MKFGITKKSYLTAAALAILIPISSFAQSDCSLEYSRLNKVIENDFSFEVKAKLKGRVFLPTKEENQKSLSLSEKFWKEYHPDSTFQKSIEDAVRTGEISDRALDQAKEIRARLKTIRFLCEAVCDDDSNFKQLDKLTVRLGRLSDSAKFGNAKERVEASQKLLEKLGAENLATIEGEISSFQAIGRSKLEKRVSDLIRGIKNTIYREGITEEEFHGVRKDIGRLQTLVLINAASREKMPEKMAYESLRKTFGELGDVHDEMVKAIYKGKSQGHIHFSGSQQKEIERIIKYFE